MSSLIDLLTSSLDDNAVAEIGRQLGKDGETTRNAIGSALPMLVGALQKSTQQDQGQGLARALAEKHDGSVLDGIGDFLSRGDRSDGAGILRHILGARQGAAVQALQSASGVEASQASGLLETLAPLVLGAVSKAQPDVSQNPGELAGMLERETRDIEARTPGVMSALSGVLDADGDGDTDLGDLLKLGSSKLGRLFR